MATTANKNSIEKILTGRAMRWAKAGQRLRSHMPISTGPSTMTNTCSTLANCSGIACSPDMKCASDQLTISGKVRIDSAELIAVSVMLSATSPSARWL